MPRPKPRQAQKGVGVNQHGSGTGGANDQALFVPQGLKSMIVAVLVLALAAVSSTASQLALSPVYGSVPSAIYHRRGIMIAALCGWFGKKQLNALFSGKLRYFIPVVASAVPTIQYLLFRQSTKLGAVVGPLVTEVLTCYPLAALCACTAAFLLEDVALRGYSRFVKRQGAFLGSYLLFSGVEKWSAATIPRYMGSSVVFTRMGLQITLAALYAMSLPSRFLLLAVPMALSNIGYNVHMPLGITTSLLNSTLQQENYVLLHRQESLTGYLSVLQNTKDEIRVLRCDHSLLGGEFTWAVPNSNPALGEPIYAVFTMLEAIRLVQHDDGSPRKADADSNALVIGLGIGTTPAALVTHGIDTTVVEIDPAVYELAIEYFRLPRNFTPELRDAVEYVESAQKNESRFDYIVHDVFTGGVEPADLFTVEFMRGLYDILTDDGAISINFAGDLSLPSAGQIVRTIKSVFPTCRIFRESEETSDVYEGDFTNMVIFCKKTASPLTFRQPVRADFLGTRSRQTYLYPKFEIDQGIFEHVGEGSQDILEADKLGQLESWQAKSAVGHWQIMRGVLSPAIWVNW